MTWFTNCLIIGLRCDKPYDIEVDPSNISIMSKYFSKKFGFVGGSSKGKGRNGKGKKNSIPKKGSKKVLVTCAELEKAFKECENRDGA